jgi:DNA modification methylase
MLTVTLGDARQLLREIPSGMIDCIITDPPYRVISGGSNEGKVGLHRPGGMLAKNDGKIFPDNELRFRDYLHDFFRVLRDPGHLYLMVNVLNMEEALSELRRNGFKLHNILAARKQNVTPNRWYMKNVEYVLFARKGAAFPINNPSSTTCHDWTNPVGQKSHPTEKSVELMLQYIENSTKLGEIVLDPFMGSGATGVAAKKSGRSFIGFEKNPEYYLTACQRIGVMPCAKIPNGLKN